MPEIRTFLTISTAHLPMETLETFNKPLKDWPCYGAQTEYGAFIWVGDFENNDYLPESMHPALNKARELGCTFVLFDCDAEELDDLPTYEHT